jgi:flavodoxin
MKTLIVYDSVFGNTEQIAREIGQAVSAQGPVELIRASQMTTDHLMGATLLVVGSPTRGFRPTEAVVKCLAGISNGQLQGIQVAAFDTRIGVKEINNLVLNVLVKLFGYAAQPIANALVKKGGTLISPPEGFFVKGTEGPLKEGERKRAGEWGRALASCG